MIGDGGRDKSHYCSLTTQTIRRRVFTPASAVDTISCADAAAMNAVVANLRNGTRGNLIRCRAAFIVPCRHAGARLIGDRYRHTSALVNLIHPVRPWYSDSERAVLDHTPTRHYWLEGALGIPGLVIPRLHDTTGCESGCPTGCTTGNRLYNRFDNRFDNRLYRVNGALVD